ncbi:catalase-like domain-containing protein [Bisporella sp. PMI_857]|nr:catalase-like domain-containing protein [Bisporella sp. PMI_857]
MLLGVGKKTSCVVRFSTTALERGSSEAVRDSKGMAVKYFTEEGNWDWVCLNMPMFFTRDPAKFPSLVHAQRRDPQTGLINPSLWWDWVCNNHESLHLVLVQYSGFGTMFNWRSMSAYTGHAFKWVMSNGSWKYVHMFLSSDQGPNFRVGAAAEADPADPDSATRDLYNGIRQGEYPTWSAHVQVIDPWDAHKLSFNILDLTKHWNLGDYFEEIEQLAFSPSHLVPGVEPSEDPCSKHDYFAYPDAQRYRLGVNYQQRQADQSSHKASNLYWRASTDIDLDSERNTWLAQISSSSWKFWEVLPTLRSLEFQERLVLNLAESISQIDQELREKVFHTFTLVCIDLAERVRDATTKLIASRDLALRRGRPGSLRL